MSSLSVESRVPPVPPPKPKNFKLQPPILSGVTSSQPAKAPYGRFPLGSQFPPPPGDSDTDSGICADSDNQLSPRRTSGNSAQTASLFVDDSSPPTPTAIENSSLASRGYLTPSSARRAFTNSSSAGGNCGTQRRLPQRPQVNAVVQTSRPGKQFRVRFADQICASEGSSSSSCISESTDTGSGANYSGYYFDRNISFDTDRVCGNDVDFGVGFNSERSVMGDGYGVDDLEALPGPPSYAVAMSRLRRSDGQRISRENMPPRVVRSYQNRSSSLPRGCHQNGFTEDRRGSLDCFTQSACLDYKMRERNAADSYLARSFENLCAAEPRMGYGGGLAGGGLPRPGSGRRLPEAPSGSEISSTGIRQPAFSRQRRAKRGQLGGRSRSAGRLPKDGLSDSNEHIHAFSPTTYRRELPSVRAQLIALDHRGFRTVVIEKLKPGPFGFYIATGILNQKRGIFVSRVSMASLAPVLSVGDEILYVEDEFVKGRSLEYVQSLIAGKTSVTIVLLPSVGPALC